jgi:cytochrome c peroxidase
MKRIDATGHHPGESVCVRVADDVIETRVRPSKEPMRIADAVIVVAVPCGLALFREAGPPRNEPIDFFMFGKAIAEFEFTLVFADAPLDRFARGDVSSMSPSQKRGALVFFGKGKCVEWHKTEGGSNEMFSDFEEHVIGVPQIGPAFGATQGSVIFSGPGENEDFGREERTGNPADRYKFRTAPLRNLAVAPGFFHDGAYTQLDDAIRFHLNVTESARNYSPVAAGLPDDLTHRVGPPVPKTLLDPRMKNRIKLTEEEIRDLVHFVENGLTDQRAKKPNLCDLIPATVPSGLPPMIFEGCPRRAGLGDPVRSAASAAIP